MPSVSVDQARAIISDLYSGPTWKEKVRTMPDKQVLAIYFSSCERDAFAKQKQKRKEKQKAMREKELNPFEDDYGEQLFMEL
jgi:hypothetical protein